jgi:nitrite reductase/ring-hydroxylating ferredoxin subunit
MTVAQFKIPIAALRQNALNVFRVNDEFTVIVVQVRETIKVVRDICPHMGGPLSKGEYDPVANTLRCPWHGYRFCLNRLELLENPNERLWVQKLAPENADQFTTPKFRLGSVRFKRDERYLYLEPK